MKIPKELTTVTPASKFLAIVLFVSLPVVGFILGMRHEQTISSPSIIKNPTPVAPQSASTANWKTFINEEFGFEIRYPKEWAFRLVSQTFVSPIHSSFAIQNTKNKTQWINILIGKEINEISPHDPISKWTIDGIPARQFSVQIIPPNIGAPLPGTKQNFPIHPGLWVEKGKTFYAFVFYGTEEIVGIFDQILSTFKFTE